MKDVFDVTVPHHVDASMIVCFVPNGWVAINGAGRGASR